MTVRMVTVVAVVMRILLLFGTGHAIDIRELRKLVVKNNVSCILTFGDSSVDPGNNNRLHTSFRGNFLPYGKDFYKGHPTGRLTNGRLATDFIADAMGITRAVPAFLDENLKKEDILHGVSFGSAASGYDELTANLSTVFPLSKQIEYLMHYKIRLRKLVGAENVKKIVGNAIFVVSTGTNDFMGNYFLEPIRSKQYTVDKYADYLISCMINHIKGMYRLGGSRFVVVGIPPLGCLPLVKTVMGQTNCVTRYNQAAITFNSKLKAAVATLGTSLGIRTAYVDVYGSMVKAMQSPKQYGFAVTNKGCVGSGEIELGESCRGLSTCKDPTKYVYWDAVHPTDTMYQIIAQDAITAVASQIVA